MCKKIVIRFNAIYSLKNERDKLLFFSGGHEI